MDVTGKMNRAFPVYRVPTSRVGAAEKLNLQSYARGRFRYIASDQLRCCFPGGTTGRTSSDGNLFDFIGLCYLEIQFRRAE